ncbi:diguanylate cyclase domain-containing protein [Grimontia sp. NTOU-MAR1]|uniref:diguanylate cyclase domain-containing protein n=1 Tax=Grimontia sp. NTOU-MAR1 TaxID=3111011 RepID=UPI002DBA653D|nr:diguanylate cyclase [Grimontia sp. NTOU-MAR1]WRV99668.1 diguanylate cyclase [Grimontia sp. NTOU-MAR1]
MILSWLNNLPLRVKLVLPTWLLMTSGVVLLGFAIENIAENKMEKSLIGRTEILTNAAAVNLTAALAFDDQRTALEQLEALRVDPELIGAWVRTSNHTLFASVMDLPIDCRFTEASIVCSDTNYERVKKPIVLGEEILGFIEVYVSREAIERERHFLVGYLVVGTTLLSLLALMFAQMLHRLVSNPLSSLHQSMSSMLRLGVFGRAIPVKHHDELGKLTACFNDLVSNLSERDYQLKQTLNQLENKSQYIGEVLDTMEHGVMVIAPGDVVTYFNPAAEYILRRISCSPRNLTKLLKTFEPVSRVQAISRAIDLHQPMKGIELTHSTTGKVFKVSTQPMGTARHSLVQFEDVTEQREAEQRRKLAELIFDKSQDATLVMSRDLTIKTQNAACIQTFGIHHSWRTLSTDSSYKMTFSELKTLLATGTMEWHRILFGHGGIEIPCQVVARTLTNHWGCVEGFVVTIVDLSAEMEIKRLNYIANHDALTGLANRAHALDKLSQDHDRERDMHVLFIDLDGFKAVNDQFGHQVGDELLKVVAERLKSSVSRRDFVSRLSGDEFLIALYGNAPVDKIASRLLRKLSDEIVINNCKPRVSASIGVRYWAAKDASSLAQVIEQADKAMYDAKANGKNRYSLAANLAALTEEV